MAKAVKKATLDDAWEIIRQLGEAQKETDRQIKEMAKETDRQIEENKKRIRYLDNLFTGQWGKLIESLVRGDLVKLLQERGVQVNRLAQVTSDEIDGKEYEYDLIAINGSEVVVVEVKTTLSVKDVDHFIEKLQHFKKVFPEYKDRKIFGAVAYLKANEGAGKNSEKKGLFVIRATGNSASITNSSKFQPKVFA
ncbi:MAG: hypothetical protein OXB88_02930 [Bacteriovoracales bacterium]|nr:hypothetical protein [Bacteriovoracales bacterium]